MSDETRACEGGCTCGHVRYRIVGKPMIVHCCHCRGCQKNSGSAFALNALYEADRVTVLTGEVESVKVPTPSGTGQIITRCRNCKVAVWSNYRMGGLLERIRFIRVGTLDDPDQLPPDIHIYTMSIQPWVRLPEGDRRVDELYEFGKTWSQDSLERLKVLEKAAGVSITS